MPAGTTSADRPDPESAHRSPSCTAHRLDFVDEAVRHGSTTSCKTRAHARTCCPPDQRPPAEAIHQPRAESHHQDRSKVLRFIALRPPLVTSNASAGVLTPPVLLGLPASGNVPGTRGEPCLILLCTSSAIPRAETTSTPGSDAASSRYASRTASRKDRPRCLDAIGLSAIELLALLPFAAGQIEHECTDPATNRPSRSRSPPGPDRDRALVRTPGTPSSTARSDPRGPDGHLESRTNHIPNERGARRQNEHELGLGRHIHLRPGQDNRADRLAYGVPPGSRVDTCASPRASNHADRSAT